MAQFEHGFALLIGVDENKVPTWSLPAVTKDIDALRQVLVHPNRCAYLPEHIKVVSGKNATRQGILDGLDWLQEKLSADTSGSATAIIHFSGHGWRDETAQPPAYYLIPYDVREDSLRSRALRVEDFADAVQALAPRRLLVTLDCCHSGGMNIREAQSGAGFLESAVPPGLLMRGVPGENTAAPEGARGWEALDQGQGRAVLSSSQGDQPSYNRRDGAMGIFTYHLVQALTGHAQPREGAREVLISDVMSHVWRCVPQSAQAEWGQAQQPDYLVSGNFPIALLLGGRGLDGGQPAPDPLAAPVLAAQPLAYTVQTGGGDYTGGNKTVHGDEVRGDKVHGDYIKVGDITGEGNVNVIGRNSHVTMTSGISGADMEQVFAPIFLALRSAPPEKQPEAAQKVQALKDEAAKGSKANDKRMASLLDGLLNLVPGMVTAVVSAFGTPLLAGIAGPVTSFVLEKFRLPGAEEENPG